MSESSPMRIGFIGAGSICRSRHLPGLAKIDGVEVVAVANRSLESSRKVCDEFDIPEPMDDWRKLVARDDLDAILIGTWPYTHEEMSAAVLEAGKHVFCQARMARNLSEAKRMAEVGDRHPKQVKMICPPPTRMPYEPFIRDFLARGGLGKLVSIELNAYSGGNLDREKLSWREDFELSGQQILAMGIWAETLHAFIGPYARLQARYSTPIPTKRVDGREVSVRIPQDVMIMGELADGVLIQEHHSGVITDKSHGGNTLTFFGLEGTMQLGFPGGLKLARPGETLTDADVPDALQRDWHVEEDFIAACRAANAGRTWSVSPDFHEGLVYMRKVAAVHEAAQTGESINPASL